jgi:hypothetical protein
LKLKKQDRETISRSCFFKGLVLALSYSKHLGATRGAYALGCWLAVSHGDAFGIFHFLFGAAFHAVCLHLSTSLFSLSKNFADYTLAQIKVPRYICDAVSLA